MYLGTVTFVGSEEMFPSGGRGNALLVSCRLLSGMHLNSVSEPSPRTCKPHTVHIVYMFGF